MSQRLHFCNTFGVDRCAGGGYYLNTAQETLIDSEMGTNPKSCGLCRDYTRVVGNFSGEETMTNARKLSNIKYLLSVDSTPKKKIEEIRNIVVIHCRALGDEWGRLRCENCGSVADRNFCPECGADVRGPF